jgi:hypothetical protein
MPSNDFKNLKKGKLIISRNKKSTISQDSPLKYLSASHCCADFLYVYVKYLHMTSALCWNEAVGSKSDLPYTPQSAQQLSLLLRLSYGVPLADLTQADGKALQKIIYSGPSR